MDRDAAPLTTTYAIVAVVITVAIAATAFRRGERWAWFAFWVWPVFFVVHGFAFFVVELRIRGVERRRPHADYAKAPALRHSNLTDPQVLVLDGPTGVRVTCTRWSG